MRTLPIYGIIVIVGLSIYCRYEADKDWRHSRKTMGDALALEKKVQQQSKEVDAILQEAQSLFPTNNYVNLGETQLSVETYTVAPDGSIVRTNISQDQVNQFLAKMGLTNEASITNLIKKPETHNYIKT